MNEWLKSDDGHTLEYTQCRELSISGGKLFLVPLPKMQRVICNMPFFHHDVRGNLCMISAMMAANVWCPVEQHACVLVHFYCGVCMECIA